MKQISILGCGWLGLPLAKSLIAKGFAIKGSTTSAAKVAVLKAAGMEAFQIEVSQGGISGDIISFLENSEILIIDIPPKLRSHSNESFFEKVQNLIPYIEQSTVVKVIFISSTSVFADDTSVVTQDTKPHPETESGKQLLQSENLLQGSTKFSSSIIRFGGLIGENRHPVYQLAGKQNLANPEAPVNLIHQADCIGIIEKTIELEHWNQTFNAVAPFHPTRKEYYTQKAAGLGLPLPEFTESIISTGKKIMADKVESELKYTFQKPNL